MKLFIILLSTFACLIGLSFHSLATEVSIQGDRFLIDGTIREVWGIRTASASQNQETTDHLIQQLDEYAAHGVNTVAVYFQGSSGGSHDPFAPDGKSIDPGHLARMRQIIEACHQRGMLVVVGIFYQMKKGGGQPHLQDWTACKEAVKTVCTWLNQEKFSNIILNIANEQNSAGHRGFAWEPVRQVEELLDLVRIAKSTHPRYPVGCGGYDHDKNIQFGLSPDVDVLLFDTLGPDKQDHSGALYDRFIKAGITNKPIVNVEIFGAWTAQFTPPGVYTEPGKKEHFIEIEDAAKRPGLSVFFHSNTWCQGPSIHAPIRYDLGGKGTQDSPGIRWYFDKVKQAKTRD
jgi:hypothetical protein